MKNVTIAIDEETLTAGRKYARAHHTSLNSMIRDLLRHAVGKDTAVNWADDFLELAKKAGGNSRGRKWTREELHRG